MDKKNAPLPVPVSTLAQNGGGIFNSEMTSLAEERARKVMFSVRELTFFLDGGPEETLLKQKFMLELERDPTWRMDDFPNLTLHQMRERTMAKARIIVHYLQNEPLEVFRKRMAVIAIVDPGFWTRLGVHYGLFFGALESQATSQQFKYWVDRGALSMNGLIGCFAMTELGHGSNVAGLETTARFDPTSDEFIIHTPTLTATKWWIGGAAQTSTHAVVYARLIVKNQAFGVKCFIVPLRYTEDFSLMPGVRIGDCGKKLGRDGIDNGYIQFTNVRIPRAYMLMRFTKVAADGTVTESQLQQLTYGALIQGRAAMVVDSGNTAKKALTIALRYAVVRRQGGGSDYNTQLASSGPSHGSNVPTSCPRRLETRLLDYTLHQHRLLPLLASTFAMHFAGVKIDSMYVSLMQQLRADSPEVSKIALIEFLKEAHANSAGLKAFCTWNTLQMVEACRQSLGGHGFSEYCGLASMMKDWTVQCSWEGDNTILALQLGRYLINCCLKVKGGRHLRAPGVAYLNNLASVKNKKCLQENIACIPVYHEAFSIAATRAIEHATSEFEAARARGCADDEAYEISAHSRFLAARVHCLCYLVYSFIEGFQSAPESLKPILELLLHNYAVSTIIENAAVFLEYGYFSPLQITFLRSEQAALLPKLRTQAIAIVDAFNLSDYVINTPLGRYDGNIYEHYFRRVQRLNPTIYPHPYFETLIKPLLKPIPKIKELPKL